jgi:two-component system OmpR family sensor kinase
MRNSLRIRLTLWYVGALAVVLVTFSMVFYSLLEKSFRQRLDGNLRSATEVTALALNHETEEHNGQTAGEENVRLVLNTMHQTSFPRPDIAVWTEGGLVAEKPGIASIPADLVVARVASQPVASPGTYSFLTIERNAIRYRVAIASVWVPSSRARYRVVANESLQPIESEMNAIGEALWFTVPICLLFAAAGSYFLARQSLAPVLEMARTAEQISSYNLEQRLAVDNPHDELGLLAESFNRVLERLQQAFRQQRQFMADASHELRTPISVALTATQVSLKGRRHNSEELYDTLEVVQSQMLRLRRVVEDMFTLAQADTGAYAPTRSALYLDEVLSESVRAGRILGNSRNVDIRVGDLVAEAAYEGDEGLLRQLVMILLDNAVKYTGAGGHVDVSLMLSQGTYKLCVADTGCGISAPDQPYIFDRFYRADKSRSRQQSGVGSGAGLGLAIARWIAHLHNGTIRLEKSDQYGSVFCVEMPAREAPLTVFE